MRAIEHAWDQARLGPGRSGELKLRTALEVWDHAIVPGSAPEERLCRLVMQWGYPEPQHQVPIADVGGQVIARADTGWPEQKVGIEYDSEEFHGPDRWASDEERHQAVTALGWTLLHADRTDLLPGERSLRDALDRAWPRAAAS